MPRVCTICTHAQREAINAALVANEPYRNVSVRFGTSVAALQRHKADHMPIALAKAKEVREAQETTFADDLYEQVKQLRNRAIKILLAAEAAGDLRTALMGIREARSCVELLLEVEGELNRHPTVNLHLSAEWICIQTVLFSALAPYPDVGARVAQALQEIDRAD